MQINGVELDRNIIMGFLGKKYSKEELTESNQKPKTIEASQSQSVICPHCNKDIFKPPEADSNPELIKHYISTLSSASLTQWEESFVNSVGDQFKRKGSLSPKQVSTLRKIFEEKA